MFIKDLHFQVDFSAYAQTHFCKDFLKKYKAKPWIETRKTISSTLERAFAFQNTNLIDTLKFSQEKDRGLFKLDFRVAGTNSSPKGSGNRVIFGVNNGTSKIEILMVYGKNHCVKNKNETQWILGIVKSNFPTYL